jgi:hypothetical protein
MKAALEKAAIVKMMTNGISAPISRIPKKRAMMFFFFCVPIIASDIAPPLKE